MPPEQHWGNASNCCCAPRRTASARSILEQTRYRVGKTDQRTVQQQHLNVYTARLSLLRVQSEQLAQRVNLHLALGGSFETRLALKTTTELNSKQTPSTP